MLGDPVDFVDPRGLSFRDDLVALFRGISADDAKDTIDKTKVNW